ILMATEMFDDDYASVLDKVTEEKGSKIEDLTLHLAALTTDGIKCMERVIDRSQELERLTLVFDNLHEERCLEKFERLIRRHGKRLTGLVLRGKSPNELDVGNGFSIDNLKLLVNCIPLNTNPVRKLRIRLMVNIPEEDKMEWDTQIARHKAKSPEVILIKKW
ncbi:hypothetical protein BGX31_002587, partial [Mortierella sp. GBA43]